MRRYLLSSPKTSALGTHFWPSFVLGGFRKAPSPREVNSRGSPQTLGFRLVLDLKHSCFINRACFRSLFLSCLLGLGLGACAGSPPTLERGLSLMRADKLEQACGIFAELLERDGTPPARLNTLRPWVECLSRSGQLNRARSWLAGGPRDGAHLYGSALVALATAPTGLPRALELLEQAEALWPAEGEIPYRRGILLLADDQPARALPVLTRACKMDDSAHCAAALGHALFDVGRVQAALHQIRRIPQLRPRPSDVRRGKLLITRVTKRAAALPRRLRPAYQKALHQLNQLDRPGATIKILEELLVDDPEFGEIYTLLGLAHLRLQHSAQATVAFRRARALSPLSAATSVYLAAIYQSRQRGDSAVEEYRRALQLNPFLWQAAHQLGKLLLSLRRPKEAAVVFEQAAVVDGGSPLSLRLAGRAYLAAGALQRAEFHFKRLYDQEPDDFEINLRLAQILSRRGGGPTASQARQRAIMHVERAAKIRPKDPELESLRTQLKMD